MKKLILIFTVILLSINSINRSEPEWFTTKIGLKINETKGELLYDNIWGTIYNAQKKQCDSTPTITGDGSIINPDSASNYRWIAICHEMLNDSTRMKMLNDNNSDRFKGKIKYGDTIWIESSNIRLNGWWIVHDTKNARIKNSVDFLQTIGDGSLYHNNGLWSGRFNDIKIYKFKKEYSYFPIKEVCEIK